MYDDVHSGGLGLLVGQDGADVGALVVHVHVLDFDAVFRRARVVEEDDARV